MHDINEEEKSDASESRTLYVRNSNSRWCGTNIGQNRRAQGTELGRVREMHIFKIHRAHTRKNAFARKL